MDIFKRAYFSRLKVHKDDPVIRVFHLTVVEECKRLISARAYDKRDWPRELGPLPDEIKGKR